MTKLPQDVDVHVGRRVRAVRRERGVSQQVLAKAAGVSFQQVQKYENGTNRISMSRAHQIAVALGVPLGELIEGLPGSEIAVQLSRADLVAALPGGQELLGAFIDMPPKLRPALVKIARDLVDAR